MTFTAGPLYPGAADLPQRQSRQPWAITGLARGSLGMPQICLYGLARGSVASHHSANWDRYAPEYRTDVMHLFSAGTTFNDVRIPLPHVRVTGLAARSTLENLRREHPTATPIIVGGDDDSLRMLFDERP